MKTIFNSFAFTCLFLLAVISCTKIETTLTPVVDVNASSATNGLVTPSPLQPPVWPCQQNIPIKYLTIDDILPYPIGISANGGINNTYNPQPSVSLSGVTTTDISFITDANSAGAGGFIYIVNKSGTMRRHYYNLDLGNIIATGPATSVIQSDGYPVFIPSDKFIFPVKMGLDRFFCTIGILRCGLPSSSSSLYIRAVEINNLTYTSNSQCPIKINNTAVYNLLTNSTVKFVLQSPNTLQSPTTMNSPLGIRNIIVVENSGKITELTWIDTVNSYSINPVSLGTINMTNVVSVSSKPGYLFVAKSNNAVYRYPYNYQSHALDINSMGLEGNVNLGTMACSPAIQ